MNFMLMPLRRYADFSGRSRRMEYWMWTLLQMLVSFGVVTLVTLAGGGAALFGWGDPGALMAASAAALSIFGLYGLYLLIVLIPSIAVSVRRLHDSDRSGWWILAPLIPYLVAVGGGAIMAASPDLTALGGLVMLAAMAAASILGLLLLIFYLLDGTPGPNRYGPDPKQRDRGAGPLR